MPETDPDLGTKQVYVYDPRLVRAGKARHASLEVATVSLAFVADVGGHPRMDWWRIVDG